MKVFADTSYYVALLSVHDQWHRRAILASEKDVEYFTSSVVVNETVSLLQARGFLSQALEFLNDVRHNPDLRIIYPGATLQSAGWDLLLRWSGAGANAVDCLSFAIMREMGIRRAYSFDDHFRIAGFEILK